MEIQLINLNYFFGVNCYLLKTEFEYFLIDIWHYEDERSA